LQQYYLKTNNTTNAPTPTTTNLVINSTLDCLSESTAKDEISPSEIVELKIASPPKTAAGVSRNRGKYLPGFKP